MPTLIYTHKQQRDYFVRNANKARKCSHDVLQTYSEMLLPEIRSFADLILLIENPEEFINDTSVSILPLRTSIFITKREGCFVFIKENPSLFSINEGVVEINTANLNVKLDSFNVYTNTAEEDDRLTKCQALCNALNTVKSDFPKQESGLYWELYHLPKHLSMVRRIGDHGDFIPNHNFIKIT